MKRPAEPRRSLLAGVYRIYSLQEIVVLALGLIATGALAGALAGELLALPYGTLIVGFALAALFVLAAGFAALRAARARRSAALPGSGDPLDTVPGPEAFTIRAHEEVVRALRSGGTVALALFDVNSLDEINRTYTRAAGDGVLRHTLSLIDATKRAGDFLARWEDDTFAVLLPECDEDGARTFIERVEHALTKEPAQVEVRGRPITIWAGVCSGAAALGPRAGNASQLFSQANEDLERAREERERRRRAWLHAA